MASAISQNTVSTNFRAMMRKFPATVTVVTGCRDGIDHGMTVTAFASVSMDPPSLVVCLNNRTYLHELLLCQPHFAVNVLSHEQKSISDSFSGKTPPEERFQPGQWRRHETGVALLSNTHAYAVGKRVAAVPFGTHTLFIGEVIDAFVESDTKPLLYEDARYCVLEPPPDRRRMVWWDENAWY